jgi:hypothetical protein
VSCLTNRFTNLLVFFAVGYVALPRVVYATRAGLKPAPTSDVGFLRRRPLVSCLTNRFAKMRRNCGTQH